MASLSTTATMIALINNMVGAAGALTHWRFRETDRFIPPTIEGGP